MNLQQSTPLSGKVALVTGAGRGTGSEIAHALAAAGAQVCVSDLNPDRAAAVARSIQSAGGDAFGWQGDIANRFQIAGTIEKTREVYGGLHILVQNAHVSPQTPALKMDEWDLRRTLEVNIIGSYFCAQLAGRVMADEGGGLIALFTRELDQPEFAAFRASQAALSTLAAALTQELADHNVAIAAISVPSSTPLIDHLINLATRI